LRSSHSPSPSWRLPGIGVGLADPRPRSASATDPCGREPLKSACAQVVGAASRPSLSQLGEFHCERPRRERTVRDMVVQRLSQPARQRAMRTCPVFTRFENVSEAPWNTGPHSRSGPPAPSTASPTPPRGNRSDRLLQHDYRCITWPPRLATRAHAIGENL
jgi:hypothetical protein